MSGRAWGRRSWGRTPKKTKSNKTSRPAKTPVRRQPKRQVKMPINVDSDNSSSSDEFVQELVQLPITKKKSNQPRLQQARVEPILLPTAQEESFNDNSLDSDIVEVAGPPVSFSAIHDLVSSKVKNFARSGHFSSLSSDEDEAEVRQKRRKKYFTNLCTNVSSDSDDETSKFFQKSKKTVLSSDGAVASTSTGPIDIIADTPVVEINDDTSAVHDESLILEEPSHEKNLELMDHELKSLDEIRKETDMMLQKASLLLDEISAPKISAKHETKPEAKPKPPEPSEGETALKVCPICLENLSNRPAAATMCGHVFCRECIHKTATTLKKCPTCRKPINSKKIVPLFI